LTLFRWFAIVSSVFSVNILQPHVRWS
jgi:hypothetical protein